MANYTKGPMSDKSTHSLAQRLPAAFLRFWTDDPRNEPGLIDAELYRLTRGQRGFHRVAPGTLAITPETGDPAIVDTALHLGQQLIELAAQESQQVRLMILPGEVHVSEDRVKPASDLLVERAPSAFANLEPGVVHVTGWVLRMLEIPREATDVTGPRDSGDQLPPLFRAGPRRAEIAPWRNLEILNRRVKAVPRETLLAAGRELLSSPVWRLEGPVGCGKSFFAHHLLLAAKTPRFWIRGEPCHRSGGSLARQVVDQLVAAANRQATAAILPQVGDPGTGGWLPTPHPEDPAEQLSTLLGRIAATSDRTFYVVIDDLEQCSASDLETISQLMSMQEVGRSFRLLLVGRSGTELPTEIRSLPSLQVEPFDEQEMSQFSPQLFSGLSLPSSTQNRLHDATLGCPFALEEAMIALIREQSLRRIYGGFFFAGQDSADFSPSPRLLSHLQAETFRVGVENPAHLLSMLETGLPPEILSEAGRELGQPIPESWHEAAEGARLVTRTDTPWGPGVGFTCPVFGSILSFGIDPDSVQNLKGKMGNTLAMASSSGKSLWDSYRLLRGTPAAIEPLLQMLDSSYTAQIPRAELLEILTQELYRHREREGDFEIEMQLLWKLLPLARKLGRLNEFTADLERAVELAEDQPRRLLALAGLKAELDQDAGRYAQAEETIRMALEVAKGADERRQALLLIQLARLQLDQERYSEAKQLLEKLADNLDRSGLDALSASCRYYLGNIAFHEENYEEALELHQEALERRQKQKLNRVAGNSLTSLGAVYLALGNYPQALKCYREALDLLEQYGGEIDRAFPLIGLGRAMNHLGDYTTAARTLREALSLREGKDDIAGEAVARLAIAENQLFLGQLDRAQEEATKALFQFNLLSRKALLADAEQLLGKIQIRLRQNDSARRHLENALELHGQKGNRRSVAFDKDYLLRLAMSEQESDEITRLTSELDEAVKGLTRPDLEEQLYFRLFQSTQWLRNQGKSTLDPAPYLEKAYRELLRKASHLDPELRHQFLFQIAEYREILEEGTRAGLTADLQD